MADELKPCPFCGGDAVLRDGECGIRGMPMTWRNPQCTRCGCDLGYCHHLEAVERWNRRALSHAAGQEGEQCRAASVTRVSTHHVHRGPDSLPCYCLASSDHQIGNEVEAGPDEVALSIARQFVPTDEPQKLAQLQCEIIRALSRGVPEDVMAKAIYEAHASAYTTLRLPAWEELGGIIGDATVEHWRAIARAAIAAQRKEGE